ncbi:sphingolipid delta-4 desaturase [Tilletia horrida]|nr:sphingolipid delta-4 desaturase [Tilletia horrida]
MLGFGDQPRSVDWSLYGGAEQVAPSQRKYLARSAGVGQGPNRTPSFAASISSSRSSSSSTYGADDSSDLNTRRNSADGSTTPPTSEEGGDDEVEVHDVLLKSSSSATVRATPAAEGKSSQLRSRSGAASSDARESLSATSPPGLRWSPEVLSEPQDPADFLWLLTEEPHRTRRAAILKDHPEIRSLMGHEPLTKYISFAVVALQLGIAVAFAQAGIHPLDWRFLLTAYVIGGTANQNTFLAIHEITHNLAFKGIRANKLWAILVNAPIGVPYAMMFKRYHIEHHKHLGEDGIDTDLPTKFELMCLKNVLGKAFFATFQIFFYALRPGFVRTQKLTGWHLLNFGFQIALDVLLVRFFGSAAMWYLIESSFFAGSLHPCAAHFIAEHYLFGGIQQETWSYYGPLNILAYNVGYHNEHHDFPSIPWTRLPALKKMAPEYYDVLPFHTSWPLVTLQFILGSDSGLFARIKRQPASKVHIPASER